ncbi:uncharacterized protein with PIN domain [Microvirga lupini]|uniref:Uncharacterized protein with PIN domain n=1 Tax=Microvirga lupini TaxID=420324 RepID=A0A7W4VIZ1_9HYPH|nr:hypothetical protein [Microvirga lupini]MBB3017641.1 uncharacterized protein with PIN domain [Microvirga lupini]
MNVCTWKAPMVTLYTGEQVPSDSEAWRAECEARHILTMTQAQRMEFFTMVEKRRGTDAAKALKMRCYELEPHYVLNLPNKQQRQHYLDAVELRFGKNPCDTLKAKLLALHAARQPVAAQVQQSA